MEERIGFSSAKDIGVKFDGVLILIVVEERIGCITNIKDLDMERFKVLILIVVEERIGFF